MDPTPDEVFQKAVRGDRDALVSLLKRHGPGVRAGLNGSIPHRWRSLLSEDDVMQQTYADATAKIGRMVSDSDSSFAKWLRTVARRNLRDAVKALETDKRGGDRNRVEAWSDDDSVAALLDIVAGTTTSPSRGAARNEQCADIRAAINKLPADYAKVVTLYDLEGRPPAEVAAALERSLGAMYMLRARAHERLHEILGRTSAFFSDSP
jgi:RNA polymerase sigma factor (sigma-70 family)